MLFRACVTKNAVREAKFKKLRKEGPKRSLQGTRKHFSKRAFEDPRNPVKDDLPVTGL